MSDAEISREIAEACGWIDPQILNGHPEGYRSPKATCRSFVPHYTHDFNAIHEAEEILFGMKIRGFSATGMYENNLNNILPKGVPIWHATAKQKAIALVKTLNKWKD